jgi:hypothetical protein
MKVELFSHELTAVTNKFSDNVLDIQVLFLEFTKAWRISYNNIVKAAALLILAQQTLSRPRE